MVDVLNRFWEKVDMSGDCWVWTASRNPKGYGQFNIGGGRMTLSHRFSYELKNCVDLRGKVLDHICWNRACVNPDHLQIVTYRENSENLSGLSRRNTSGVRGVSWDSERGKWSAIVGDRYKSVHVGRFDRLEDAEAAVIAKRNELYTNNLKDREN